MIDFIWKDRRASENINDLRGIKRPKQRDKKWRVINVRMSKYRLSRRYHNYLMEMSKKVRR